MLNNCFYFPFLDVPCNMFLQFYIINSSLNLNATLRSNDLVYGTPYNVSYFFKIFGKMYNELKKVYPELKVGYYRHQVTSLHIYEKHKNKVISMIYGDNDDT